MQNQSKEVFQIAGDAPDPTGADPSARGVSVGHDFTAAAAGHPVILATIGDRPVLLTADVYKLAGQPAYVHIICPMCLAAGHTHALRIVEGHKAISFELEQPPTWPGWSRADMRAAIADMIHVEPVQVPAHMGGRLSIEAFACTWEGDPMEGREFSFSRCPWAVVIDNNVARSVR